MLDTYLGHVVNKAKDDAEAVLNQFGISTNELDDYQAVFTDYGVGFVGGQLPDEIEKIMFPDGISNGDSLVEGEYINPIENLGNNRKTVLIAAAQLWASCRFLLNRQDITKQEASLAGYSIGRLRLAMEFPVIAKEVVSDHYRKNADRTNKPFEDAEGAARDKVQQLWSEPPYLNKSDMIEKVRVHLEENQDQLGLPRVPSGTKIWEWIKELAPDEVRKPGRPKKNSL